MAITITSMKSTRSELPASGAINTPRSVAVRKVLLTCGILASLWYVALNLFIPMLDPAYNSSAQTVSELSAIGAPTRAVWNILCVPFTQFFTAFGCGVWLAAGRNRPLLIAGVLLTAYALIGIFWPPMHQREVLAAGGATLTDTLHIVFTAVTGTLMMLAMGFSAAALGKRFRYYTVATILILLVFGALTGAQAPQMEANLPTPLIGVWERVNIYATMLWVVVLAVVLLRREKQPYFPGTGTAV